MHIILCHGFGFDHHFWDHFIPYLSKHSYSLMDLGHINTPCQPLFKDDLTIGIGHSLGFLKLCMMENHFNALIGFNGFFNFLGYSTVTTEKRLKEFHAFKKIFIQNPIKTLENFYQRCGVDDIMPIPQSCNLNTMSKDLDVLKKDVVPPKIPTLLLSSMDDPIVPNIVIHEHKNEYYHIFFEHIEGAQHAMGLKKTEQIFQKVMSFLHTHQIL